jgi:hypothetical protein
MNQKGCIYDLLQIATPALAGRTEVNHKSIYLQTAGSLTKVKPEYLTNTSQLYYNCLVVMLM